MVFKRGTRGPSLKLTIKKEWSLNQGLALVVVDLRGIGKG